MTIFDKLRAVGQNLMRWILSRNIQRQGRGGFESLASKMRGWGDHVCVSVPGSRCDRRQSPPPEPGPAVTLLLFQVGYHAPCINIQPLGSVKRSSIANPFLLVSAMARLFTGERGVWETTPLTCCISRGASLRAPPKSLG